MTFILRNGIKLVTHNIKNSGLSLIHWIKTYATTIHGIELYISIELITAVVKILAISSKKFEILMLRYTSMLSIYYWKGRSSKL